jgi:fatty acid amide hydrolase
MELEPGPRLARETQGCTTLGAAELAARLREGVLGARDVVEAHIRRIQEVNPALNAVVVPLFEEARAHAEAADARRARGEVLGPLHGVPFTVKECFDVKGAPSTLGLSDRVGHTAREDSPLVARLRAAGAILLGKTNLSLLLHGLESDNAVYGRTNNPYDLGRSSGGSSGGEAAILAAGGSALGLGSDVGGSIRVPAHCCGIHGLKPTSGRLNMLGSGDQQRGQEAVLDQAGPMARHVADLRLAMTVLTSGEQGVNALAVPPVAWRDPARVSLQGLRVGFYTEDGFIDSAPAVARAVREAAVALRERGAEVIELPPPDVARAISLYLGLLGADGGATKRRLLGAGTRDPNLSRVILLGRLPEWSRRLLAVLAARAGQRRLAHAMRAWGERSVDAYWRLIDARNAYRAAFLARLDTERIDALLCPPYPLPAVPHGDSARLGPVNGHALLFNLMGLPAGVVAATRVRSGEESMRSVGRDRSEHVARRIEVGSAGLPIGVQVAARPWREDVVLAVMEALELGGS